MTPKLFLGLPIYAQANPFFMQCLLALQAQKPFPIEVRMCAGDGVARSRNGLTADFLRSDCSHLLFIDTDLIFSMEQVARIVSHDLPIVGGLYPKKQEGPTEWVLNGCLEPGVKRDDRGLLRVRYIGTGFMCIRRDVFGHMARSYPQIAYTSDCGDRRPEYDFWSMGVFEYPDKTRRYLSEDWYFCQRWLDLGGQVFADTHTVLKHVGHAIYPLETQTNQLLKLGKKQQSTKSHALK